MIQFMVSTMYKVYGDKFSGDCYKISLLMSLLQIEYEWIPIDILKNETRSEVFLARNPIGQVPVLELADGNYLYESNAILNYLAEGTEFLPDDPLNRARVLQWQFFEQYSHEPYIAVARFIQRYLGMPEDRRAEYESKQAGGHRALAVMDSHLSKVTFLVNDAYSIADISLYAYTHVAEEGGFSLDRYPAIQVWLKRIARQEKHCVMGAK